jgi:hypothetical protein
MSSTFGGVTAPQPWSGSLQNQGPNPQQVLQPVAQLLGTTSQDLINQMQSGSTLSDIANKQGVSQSDLISAIEQGLQSANTASGTTAPADLTTVATNIANGTAKIGHHHHHHHGAGAASSSTASLGLDDSSDDDSSDGSSSSPATSTVSSLASVLGLDPSTVQQLLNSGASVSSLASGSGLPAADLQSLFSTGLQIDTTA